jgi:hypothetical protein
MKLCINCRSFSTSAFLNSDRSENSDRVENPDRAENPDRVEKTDSEIEFDKDGSEAKAHSEEIMQDIEDLDKAREGDLEAQKKLEWKYPNFLDEKITDDQGNLKSTEAKLGDLEKALERDFELDKDDRDIENKREGRSVSPPIYDETEENSPISSDQDESSENNEKNDRSGPSTGSGSGPSTGNGSGPSTGNGSGPSTGSGSGPSTGSGSGPSTGSGSGPSTGSGSGPSTGTAVSPIDHALELQSSEMPSIFEQDGGD